MRGLYADLKTNNEIISVIHTRNSFTETQTKMV